MTPSCEVLFLSLLLGGGSFLFRYVVDVEPNPVDDFEECDFPIAIFNWPYHGRIPSILQLLQGSVEIINLESQVIQLVTFFEGACDRAVICVPVDLQPMLLIGCQEVCELTLIRRGFDTSLQLHPEDTREELNCLVEVPDTYARVTELESHGKQECSFRY